MLEWAGISFGEEFTYKLGKSIKVKINNIELTCFSVLQL